MLTKCRLILSIAALGSLPSSFMAQEEGLGPDEELESDGLIELLSSEQLKGIHAKFDSNKDGKASLEEMLRYGTDTRIRIARQDAASILEDLDSNKNGKLELSEHLTRLKDDTEGMDEEEKELIGQTEKLETEKFKLADADKDGVLSENEIPALFYPEVDPATLALVTKAQLERRDKNGDGKLSVEEVDDERPDFKSLDKDGDGFLTFEELIPWESGHFHTKEALSDLLNMADADNDGHVSEVELEQAREKMRGSDAEMSLAEWIEHEEL